MKNNNYYNNKQIYNNLGCRIIHICVSINRLEHMETLPDPQCDDDEGVHCLHTTQWGGGKGRERGTCDIFCLFMYSSWSWVFVWRDWVGRLWQGKTESHPLRYWSVRIWMINNNQVTSWPGRSFSFSFSPIDSKKVINVCGFSLEKSGQLCNAICTYSFLPGFQRQSQPDWPLVWKRRGCKLINFITLSSAWRLNRISNSSGSGSSTDCFSNDEGRKEGKGWIRLACLALSQFGSNHLLYDMSTDLRFRRLATRNPSSVWVQDPTLVHQPRATSLQAPIVERKKRGGHPRLLASADRSNKFAYSNRIKRVISPRWLLGPELPLSSSCVGSSVAFSPA